MLTGEKRSEFAICVASEGYEDLEVWKVYRILPDAKAGELGCVRVVDNSGEDYLYPADRFVAVDFPQRVRERLPRWQPDHGPERTGPATAKRRRRLRTSTIRGSR